MFYVHKHTGLTSVDPAEACQCKGNWVGPNPTHLLQVLDDIEYMALYKVHHHEICKITEKKGGIGQALWRYGDHAGLNHKEFE